MDVSLQANSTQTRGNGKGRKGSKERGKRAGLGVLFFAEPKSRSQVKSRTVWEWRTAPRSRVRKTVRPSPQAPVSELSAWGAKQRHVWAWLSASQSMYECVKEKRRKKKAALGELM